MEAWLKFNIITMITSYFLSVLRCLCLCPQVTPFKALVFVITSYFTVICDHKLLPFSVCYLWSQVTSFIVICDQKLLLLLSLVITSYFLSVCVKHDHKLLPLLLFLITHYFLYCYLWSEVASFIVTCDHKLLPFSVCYLWSQVTSCIVICDHKLFLFSVMVYLLVTTSYFL